jgi:hypothetical protein
MKTILTILISLMVSTAMAQVPKTRPLSELINKQEPYWDIIKTSLKTAKNKVEVLPKNKSAADSALLATQVTTRSPMGAVVYETGGILIDNGWLRILGSGSSRLNRTLMGWNKGKSYKEGECTLPFLLIADDVMGGFYAVNNGGISQAANDQRKVFYFAPDNLKWEPMDMGYGDFLNFCINGDLKSYYQSMYWTGWENEVAKLDGNKGYSCIPMLFTKEGKDVNKVSRKAVPIEELWGISQEIASQLNGK